MTKQNSKQNFVKLMRYSTPITIGLILYLAFMLSDLNPFIMIIFGVLIGIEFLTALKAESIYDSITPSSSEKDDEDNL
jgi:hypothetical protein